MVYPPNDLEAMRRDISNIRWWHKIDLGNGIITPGVDSTPEKLQFISMHQDLSGKSVLDIGAWDGFFSFEAERRGAKRVVALDHFIWKLRDQKKGFELARKILKSKVEDVDMDLMDISPKDIGIFDYVLFLGVLYHLRHPLIGLEKVASVTRGELVLETQVDLCGILGNNCRPSMRFYPGRELSNDPTNWWGPNPAAVVDMLKDVGFAKVMIINKLPIHKRWASAILNRHHSRMPLSDRLQLGRIVIHASK